VFMAPEVIQNRDETTLWKKADVWSVGCTVIEMATGSPPWSQYSNPVTAMYHIACVESIPPFPSQLSVRGHNFLSACLNRKPEKRWDTTRLLLHPFVIFKEESSMRPDSAMVLHQTRPLTAGTGQNLFSREKAFCVSPTFSRTITRKIVRKAKDDDEDDEEGEVFILDKAKGQQQKQKRRVISPTQQQQQQWASYRTEEDTINSYGRNDMRPVSPDISIKFPSGT